MSRLRRDTQETIPPQRPLRIIASGTLFVTHTLGLPTQPTPTTMNRAHSVSATRGGSASNITSLLAQFPNVDAMLVAPLSGNRDGQMILRDLDVEGVNTKYCKIWEKAGVPSAWVLQPDDSDTRTVINHNPLPDITHEEFVSLLGPLLAPENYAFLSSPQTTAPSQSPPTSNPNPATLVGSPNGNNTPRTQPGPPPPAIQRPPVLNPNSPAPFEWLHFEGRSVKTTLNNMLGVDGLARERKWRSHCVFSVDVGRRARQGVEALIPHADVLFLNKHYAQAHSPHYSATPRAFLLSLTQLVPQHALLVAHWGTEGSALLSLPTREYFQSSGWVDHSSDNGASSGAGQHNMAGVGAGGNHTKWASGAPRSPGQPVRDDEIESDVEGVHSVRTGSDFWAGSHSSSFSTTFTAREGESISDFSGMGGPSTPYGRGRHHGRSHNRSSSSSSQDTEIASDDRTPNNRSGPSAAPQQGGGGGAARASAAQEEFIDEVGAQDAFVAGMIFALSRRIVPGAPYTPSAITKDGPIVNKETEKGRWRLEECLRFATELAGRKARRRGWDGLAGEMVRAGWFEG
ncbi:hypothetical protein JAAARDRAFT_206877 [Jaapia argillacea MUCL 33604]|uniref:Carbohydrate kinase PfkB domain-containing protein n=1 Tax=Jaapia argillacea MUCL 33604 TaxID=933084 RepID=A0A067PTQ1_9AGAM|nr:hypothetical protein JAAARDRAFT_206877 [Jaapia argillacea MUCL 33604]